MEELASAKMIISAKREGLNLRNWSANIERLISQENSASLELFNEKMLHTYRDIEIFGG